MAAHFPQAEPRRDGNDNTHKEGLRKKAIVSTSEVQCPVCTVTLRPGSMVQHYQQELEKAKDPYKGRRKRSRVSSQTGEDSSVQSAALLEKAHNLVDAVKRRRFRFHHGSHNVSHDQPGPSGGSHQQGSRKCPVCDETLPADEEAASRHVTQCLQSQDVSSGEEETYEEYTWCNVTRVRATSLLTPQTRANILNGTVISRQEGEGGSEDIVDVELDTSVTYGPSQFVEEDLISTSDSLVASGNDEQGLSLPKMESESEHRNSKASSLCLICMDMYSQPVVSVQCWHVFCEKCWLQALGTQKLCPKCKTITCAGDLRRIFL